MPITVYVASLEQTLGLGEALGKILKGGEVFELASDLGGGKTAFVKGLARGLSVKDIVQSPTFTISRIYHCDRDLELHHFDFYRLDNPGVMSAELFESLQQPGTVVAVEWSDIVHDILPEDHITVKITATGDDTRKFEFKIPQGREYLLKTLQEFQHEEKLV